MEAQEQVMGSKDHNHMMMMMIKRKRTKRQRPMSPLALTMGSSSSCSTAKGGGGGGGGGSDNNSIGYDHDHSAASPHRREDEEEQEKEEEDMAKCLILLAQGQTLKPSQSIATPTKSPKLFIYQCKTCDRCFPSFQALGGHRASHRKPKPVTGKNPVASSSPEENQFQFNNDTTTLSLQISNRDSCGSNKTRVHSCSLCGAEFTSGQALGGHMRRHRPMPVATTSGADECQETKKQRNLLSLDLNLPAPEDDHRETKLGFASKEQVIVFSASALVDCHY